MGGYPTVDPIPLPAPVWLFKGLHDLTLTNPSVGNAPANPIPVKETNTTSTIKLFDLKNDFTSIPPIKKPSHLSIGNSAY